MGLGNWFYRLCMFWFLAWPRLCYYSLGFENGYGFGLECRLYVLLGHGYEMAMVRLEQVLLVYC